MEISLFLLGMLGCVLIAATVRMGLHEACHRLDGEKPVSPGRWSTTPYWLAFQAADEVTFEEGREAFHDQSARFAALECAMHDAARVNAKRKVRGQPAYTMVRGADGSERPLREVED